MAMLQMATKSLTQNASGKKMLFKPHFLFIDESILYNYSYQPVEAILKTIDFPYEIIKIEQIFKNESEEALNRERFLKLVDATADFASSREDLLF